MLQASLNNYFIIAAVVMGAISILINWFYMIETVRGIYITEFSVVKKYVLLPFIFSLVMLSVLWVTTYELDALLLRCFWGLTIGWFVTIIAAFVIPGVAKTHLENRKNVRKIIFPCILKVIIMMAVLWLMY